MSDPVREIVLIGLPSTGKTSFLAALWYMVNQTTVDCKLILDRVDGSIKHLNDLKDAWLAYKPVPRTLVETEKVVSMALKYRASGRLIGLTFPDLSGESFRLQWTDRQFASSYDSRLRQSCGAILFVHPETVVKPHRIDTVNSLMVALEDGDEAEVGGPEIATARESNWVSEHAPTQVQLVELLQFVAGRDYFRPPFRIAIVVSAWDLLASFHLTPNNWVSTQLPLLQQFLDCNKNLFEIAFYGVSAQGGRYTSWRFLNGDIKDTKGFAKRLVERNDGISSWLWEQLAEPGQNSLKERMGQSGDATMAQGAIVNALNKLMTERSIYDSTRFANVKLRTETVEIRDSKKTPEAEDIAWLNRLLLEDAYPTELSRDRQFGKEQAALEKILPSRRVSIVGPDGLLSHDITEPVQWLTS